MDINPEFPSQLEEQVSSKRFLIRIISLDRLNQKTFCTTSTLEEAIKKGQQYGCDGSKILLADDGCEVCDDESFLYYILHGAKFMIVDSADDWQPPESKLCVIRRSISSELLRSESSQLDKHLRDKPILIQQMGAMGVEQSESDQLRMIESRATTTILAEEKFKNIDVPWSQIPLDIRDALAKGLPLDDKVHTLCNLVVHELRSVSTNIPIRVLRLLAHRLVSRYPKSFQKPGQSIDVLPTVLNLALAMRHHNNYLNRNDKTALPCSEGDSEWQDYVEEND